MKLKCDECGAICSSEFTPTDAPGFVVVGWVSCLKCLEYNEKKRAAIMAEMRAAFNKLAGDLDRVLEERQQP